MFWIFYKEIIGNFVFCYVNKFGWMWFGFDGNIMCFNFSYISLSLFWEVVW